MNKILRAIALLSLLLAGSSELRAEELQENFVPLRPLGMGGAFTAIANDETAVWTNPAGVSRMRKAYNRKTFFLTKIPDLGVGANSRAKKVYQASGGSGLADTIAESGDLGENNPYWANLHIFPSTFYDYNRAIPGAFGVFSNTTTRMLVSEDSPEQTQVRLISDIGALTNISWTNKSNRISIGMNLRYIVRYAYEDSVPTSEISDKTALQARFKESANKYSGIGVDAGLLYTFADFWFPTIGLSALNLPTGCKANYLNPATKTRQTVCGTLYRGTVANDEALSAVDPTDLRVGLSITPRLSRSVGFRLGLDAHHLYAPMGTSNIGLPGVEVSKMLHGGIELFWGNPLQRSPFSLRAGIGQGFLSTGISLNLPYWSIDFTTYGVDVSSTAKPIEDRRYLLGTSLYW